MVCKALPPVGVLGGFGEGCCCVLSIDAVRDNSRENSPSSTAEFTQDFKPSSTPSGESSVISCSVGSEVYRGGLFLHKTAVASRERSECFLRFAALRKYSFFTNLVRSASCRPLCRRRGTRDTLTGKLPHAEQFQSLRPA